MAELGDTATLDPLISSTPSTHVNIHPDDWRNQNYRFEDIPADMQGHVRTQLQIPIVQVSILLPEPKLSVLDLISTFVPPISPSEDQYAAPANHCYFSTAIGVPDIELMSRITVPPRGIITELISSVKQQYLDGYVFPTKRPHFHYEQYGFGALYTLRLNPGALLGLLVSTGFRHPV
ncbi:hypothetical protein DXG01_012742 [Tephrocybe rancida]|nr:hypothetical protein DXG01_012742 [Tephrocybe rancida]